MNVQDVLFYVLSALVLLTGGAVVRCRNLVHAAFWTMPCFLIVALMFLLLQNELLFTVQLLLYAGAIPITVLFVLMLTHEVMSERRVEQGKLWPVGAFAAIAFFGFSVYMVSSVNDPFPIGTEPAKNLTAQIGKGFLTDYVLPFEAASLMLLGALVGAIYLAHADRVKKPEAQKTD